MDYFYKSVNRSTTFESLTAVVGIIYADDKETFRKFYKVATHDDAGLTCWGYMYGETDKPKLRKKSVWSKKYASGAR